MLREKGFGSKNCFQSNNFRDISGAESPVVQLLSHVLKEVTQLERGRDEGQDGKQAQLTTVYACLRVPIPASVKSLLLDTAGILSPYPYPRKASIMLPFVI